MAREQYRSRGEDLESANVSLITRFFENYFNFKPPPIQQAAICGGGMAKHVVSFFFGASMALCLFMLIQQINPCLKFGARRSSEPGDIVTDRAHDHDDYSYDPIGDELNRNTRSLGIC